MILLLSSCLIAFILYATKDILLSLLGPWLSPSPLLRLKGPNWGTLLYGHTHAYTTVQPQPEKWLMRVFDKFGPVTVIRAPFNSSMLSSMDLKVATHIFNHPEIYQKSPGMRFEFETFIGHGIFTVEGNDHRRQRKAISPAFGAQPIREMCDMFISKSMDLRDELGRLFHPQSGIIQTQADLVQTDTKAGWVEVDMLSWLSRMSLDAIGLAGFDHSFDSITNGDEGLLKELENVLSEININLHLVLLKGWIPLLRLWTFDEDSRRTRHLRESMRKIAKDVVAKKMNAIKTGSADARSRDLLTLLIRANQAETNSTRLSDEEVLGQVPSFIVGAHEGVAAAVAWTLFTLGTEPGIQTRLRTELESLANDNPTADELNSLTYLDHVVRESLRFHSISSGHERRAVVDDRIPSEPYQDRQGNMQTEILIAKGDFVRIPVWIINHLESLWGPDANEFNPDRWKNLPKTTEGIPGVWGNQPTFLAGYRSCPGWRFALLEMKAILFVLIKAYEFELAVPKENVWRRPFGSSAYPQGRKNLQAANADQTNHLIHSHPVSLVAFEFRTHPSTSTEQTIASEDGT